MSRLRASCVEYLSRLDSLFEAAVSRCNGLTRHTVYAATPDGPSVVSYSNAQLTNSPCFIIPHEDEQTAFDVALVRLATSGGQVFRVEQSGNRNIVFERDRLVITVDPNRVHSEEGLRKTVNTLNKDLPASWRESAAALEIRAFSDALLAALETCLSAVTAPVVIAVHNNRDSPTSTDYSIESYEIRGDLASDAELINGNPAVQDALDRDDFFLVTKKDDFERLAASWNVVLQSAQVTDDGSLSVHYKDVRYINVEAQHGSFAQQAAMLQAVTR